jgi:CHAT domain-containing protein
LIERFEISLATSATSWRALRMSQPHQLSRAALGLGAVTWTRDRAGHDATRGPEFADEQLALPRSRDEVQSMVDTVGGESRALFASRASEASFKRLDLSPYGVIHFATHAVVNAGHASRSAILLVPGDPREDGLLQPREIAKLNLDGKLVVLSACSSADGRELRGEGALSLARSFLGSGARAVIGTIWPVRDSEAATLAEHFYLHLARGATVAASLAGAQRELSVAGAPPAAWAGFVLVGDGSATLAPQPAAITDGSPGSLWAVILACGLAVVTLTWLQVREN